jgi:hypothetical protein
MKVKRKVVVVTLVAAALGVGGGRAGATAPPKVTTIADGLVGPLQLAVDDDAVYVAQDFIGVLTRIGEHGERTDVAANPGGEIAGVAVGDRGVLFTTTNPDANGSTVASGLSRAGRRGSTVVADLFSYEQTANPDQGNAYGFESISPSCAAQLPAEIGPAQYHGILDSHPYSVATRDGKTYIAEAAGNAVLEVTARGQVRTVAVLPPQPALITADAASANGLPACTVGLTYDFEPVPTDVEIGSDGKLFVTTLPGGPEDPSLGARGSVFRIDPRRHTVTRVASGINGATNLALGRHGDIYVSELFGGHVSKIVNGAPVPVVDLPSPAALEYAHGRLYVGYDVFGNGTVATIDLG